MNDDFVGILIVPDDSITPVSWGHARDYGALVINPTQRPRAHGSFIGVKRGTPMRLRYGLMFYVVKQESSIDQRVSALEEYLNSSKRQSN